MKRPRFASSCIEALRLSAISMLLLVSAIAGAAPPKVHLRFTVWDGDESLKIIRKALAIFAEQNKDIDVKLENFGDYTLYHQKMLTQYAANVAPDVAMMDMGNFQRLAKRGALLPLNEYCKTTPGFDIKAYYEPIVKAHSWNGNLYVLPRDIAPEGILYYNKKAFDEAGIPYPDGTWTWDFKERPELKDKDFLWVCRKLTKHGKTLQDSRWALTTSYPELIAQTFLFETGGYPVDNSEEPKKVLMDSPVAERAYQFAADLMNKQRYMPNSTETSGALMATATQLFASQKVAMYQNGIWEVPNIRKAVVPGKEGFFDWDITLFPAYKDGKLAAPTGGSGYAIFSSTPHPEESWRLTRFMCSPVVMSMMARAGIAQPAIKSVATEPGIWLPGPNTPKDQLYPYHRIFTHMAVPYVKFAPSSELYPMIQDRIVAGQDLLWNGQATSKQILGSGTKNAQDRLDTMLKEEKLPLFDWRIGICVGLLMVAVILFFVYIPERKIKYTYRERKENATAYRFAAPWLIGTVVFTLGPMIFSLLMSFADWDIILPAHYRGLQNYAEAGAFDPLFWKSMTVTAIYTIISVPLGLCMALGLALLLNLKIRGIPIFRCLYYIPSLASMVAAALIWRRIFNPDNGLVNSILYSPKLHALGDALSVYAGTPGKHVDWLGSEKLALPGLIIMSVWGAGGGMVILLAGLQGIPQHYYEAATLDGANAWGKFRSVTLPLLTPTLFFSLITGFIGSFQAFTQVYVINNAGGGPNDSTRMYMIHLWKSAFEQLRMGYASALAWILFFIILVVTLIQVKGAQKWVYYEADIK